MLRLLARESTSNDNNASSLLSHHLLFPFSGYMSSPNASSALSSNDGIWGFSLRHDFIMFDDDDELVINDVRPNEKEAQLLQDLDFASRPDETQYTPNPWTIAKINAATTISARDSKPDPPQRRSDVKRVENGKKKRDNLIANAFQRQRAKAQAEHRATKACVSYLRSYSINMCLLDRRI